MYIQIISTDFGGIRDSIDIEALQRKLGKSKITFNDVCNYLRKKNSKLTRAPCILYNRDGRLVQLSLGSDVEAYRKYEIFYIYETIPEAAVTLESISAEYFNREEVVIPNYTPNPTSIQTTHTPRGGKGFYSVAVILGVLLLGYWAYLDLTPEEPVRVWPSEAPSLVCNGYFGDSYAPTGPNSATFFNVGGCGSWKIFYVVPGGELRIFSSTSENNQLGVAFNKWDINYYIDDFFDGQWNQMKFVPPNGTGDKFVNYIPRGSKIRIRGSDAFYVIVEQKKPLPNYVENLKQTPIPTPASIVAQASQQKTITNSIGMEFVQIPAGEFDMGSPPNEGRYDFEGPVHHIKISNAFYMTKYEITQKQWRDVMGINYPSKFKGENLPVEMVSWNDVQDFIRKLNEKEGANNYRLPTEAEWEYAARAGTTTRYSYGDSESKLGDYAWYDANSGKKTHEVGQKKPNPWGLYDMQGNVWEWVQDIHHKDYSGAPTDGSSWENGSGSIRIYRGGSWNNDAKLCRSASRVGFDQDSHRFDLGFRLLRVL
jgi:formylglycine-generating enzyme required for sulfatase activity